MILDVHVAYLFASLSVLFGLTYSISRFFDYKIQQMKEAKDQNETTEQEEGVLLS